MTNSTIDGERTADRAPLRGREAEQVAIAQRLHDAKAGRGSVVLVEGRSGFGKTRLLEEARASAEAAGFTVGVGAAVRGDGAASMTPLLTALFDGPTPVLDRRRLADVSSLTDRTFSFVHRLEAPLEHAARSTPVLVCLDDAQWIDGGTAAALRILPQRLADLPVVWIVAFRSGAAPPELTDLASRLRRHGAETLSLGRLDDAAIERLAADIVHAQPTIELLEFARQAGGSPSLLVELIGGLVEEELVRVNAGRAELAETRLPQRVCDLTRDALARLSALARQAVAVASILGKSVSFDHVAAMLGVSPASLLGPVEELVASELLVDVGERLGFDNELIRQAVVDVLPLSLRHALQRQAIDVLLEAGVSPIEPAATFATSAQAGDRAAISTLIEASRALSATDPEAAAGLSRRAFDLTAPGDELRGPVVAELALMLHAAGRAGEGKVVADAALRDRLAPEHEAEVRMSVARMSDLSPEVRVEAGRVALALPDLPITLRARHLSELVVNMLASGYAELAKELLPEAETTVASSGDRSAALALAVAKSRLAYMEGAFEDGLAQIDSSLLGARSDVGASTRVTDLLRAELLIAVDDFDAAHQVAEGGVANARRDRQSSAARSWERFLGQYLLQTGRIADAATTLDRVFGAEHAGTVTNVGDAAVLLALGRIAIHTGDGRRVRSLAKLAKDGLACGGPELRRHFAWFLALQAMAAGDATGARARLAALGEDAAASVLPLFMVDVADHPQLVRIALAAGDDEMAAIALEAAEERQHRNPGVNSIAAAAAHARGLHSRDLPALAAATELLADGPRRLARASALEDYGVALVRDGNRCDGVDLLGQALQIYSNTRAAWDASRVRQRLRDLGVRRRLVKPARPATGWPSLTDAEVAVVRLVAEGLTNREAAERLFISAHTVSMHLRHVFTKLEITSRVALTRLAYQHEAAA